MSDEITFAGKPYVSSKRASKISGYAQDYIGQLARSSQIEAQRVGGLWYVSMDSLLGYRKDPLAPDSQAQTHMSEHQDQGQPSLTASGDVDSLIAFDGKDYISASRASKLTGYNQDYVGQLARSGQILARQVGNRWYVDREGIQNHKQEKDALLAAVQVESVGLLEPKPVTQETVIPESADMDSQGEMKYYPDEGDLLPVMNKAVPDRSEEVPAVLHESEMQVNIPIRLIRHSVPVLADVDERKPAYATKRHVQRNYGRTGALAAAALTVVIVLSFGVVGLKNNSTYVLRPLVPSKDSMAASVARAFDSVAAVLETVVSPEMVYRRE